MAICPLMMFPFSAVAKMADYIDLSDDSDDDIPLLPSKKHKLSPLPQTEVASLDSATESELVDLLSSDDEIPVFKAQTSNSSDNIVQLDDNNSDKTDRCSDLTERYSDSSDLESLPDINIRTSSSAPSEPSGKEVNIDKTRKTAKCSSVVLSQDSLHRQSFSSDNNDEFTKIKVTIVELFWTHDKVFSQIQLYISICSYIAN